MLKLKSSYVRYQLETSCLNCSTIPDSDIDSAKIFNVGRVCKRMHTACVSDRKSNFKVAFLSQESNALIFTNGILYQGLVKF